jgi:hypothetical protein
MSEAIVVAVITSCLTLIGTVITVLSASKKTDEQFRINQAVIDTKIEELTREVREHNNFARRLPLVEERLEHLTARVTRLESEDDRK